MFRIFIFLLLTAVPLYSIPPSPKILKNVIESKWPSPFSVVFTEPAGRNLIPGQFYFPSAKEKILVILTEFSDYKFSHNQPVNKTYGNIYNKNYFSRLIFGGDFNKKIIYNKKYNSLKRYFLEISYNQCELVGGIIQVTLNKEKAYYTEDSNIEVDNENATYYQIIKDAVLKAEANIDLGSYDYDQDGYIDHVMVIASVPNQAAYKQTEDVRNNCIWPKRVLFTDFSEILTLNNGKKVGWGVIITCDSSVGVAAHEFFHECGAFDLHDPDWGSWKHQDDNDYPVSYWGLMGSMGPWNCKEGQNPGDCPSHPLGFHKWKMGWIEPETIVKSQEIKVKAIEKYQENCLYKINVLNTGGNEYFLLENRSPSLLATYYDKHFYDNIQMDAGIIITHVDENMFYNYYDNFYMINWSTPEFAHYAVRILDTQPFFCGFYDERKIDAAFSKQDLQINCTSFHSYGSMSSYKYGKDLYIIIKDISSSGKVMKATVILNTK